MRWKTTAAVARVALSLGLATHDAFASSVRGVPRRAKQVAEVPSANCWAHLFRTADAYRVDAVPDCHGLDPMQLANVKLVDEVVGWAGDFSPSWDWAIRLVSWRSSKRLGTMHVQIVRGANDEGIMFRAVFPCFARYSDRARCDDEMRVYDGMVGCAWIAANEEVVACVAEELQIRAALFVNVVDPLLRLLIRHMPSRRDVVFDGFHLWGAMIERDGLYSFDFSFKSLPQVVPDEVVPTAVYWLLEAWIGWLEGRRGGECPL